ncbi:chromate resistance protein ChrB domain-containing protein [Dactylosporangium sp. NPDC049140]|uniref:chromate resistance protein ChrB domain-containing protein n=1 Tax=Dactylosporangium sp. NPDC049140 TaxID=3155647 RepID=UPI0033D23776
MRWATRAGVHVDRVACAWLIRRHIDPDAQFHFVDPGQTTPDDATAFDMRGAELGHHDGDCSLETILRRYELTDPVLWKLAELIHEADLGVILRGLSMLNDDQEMLRVGRAILDGLHEYHRRRLLLGREPA